LTVLIILCFIYSFYVWKILGFIPGQVKPKTSKLLYHVYQGCRIAMSDLYIETVGQVDLHNNFLLMYSGNTIPQIILYRK
jgi:hypothetical protein